MLCRECERETRGRVLPANGNVPDQLCSRCNRLLGADAIVERVQQKQSQLARFGLAGSRRPLLKRAR